MNKRIITVLFLTFIFLTLYNTLIPFTFDYGLSDLPEQISKISLPDLSDLPLTDIVGNILLFIPFGFLGFVYLSQRNFRNPFVFIGIAGFGLSLLIEFLQLFIANRNTAPHDLFNNTFGTIVGATAAAIYAGAVGRYARKALLELYKEQPYTLIPVTIAIAQSIAAIMPFTVSITVSALKRSLKSTNIIPFDSRLPKQAGRLTFRFHSHDRRHYFLGSGRIRIVDLLPAILGESFSRNAATTWPAAIIFPVNGICPVIHY